MFTKFTSAAERRGFEPLIRFWRIHAFQACLFNHSSTFPDASLRDTVLENERKLRIIFLFRAIFATKVLFFFRATIKKHEYSSKKVIFTHLAYLDSTALLFSKIK